MRAVRGAALLWLALAITPMMPGCDSHARAIRAELSDSERQRFDRGQKIAVVCWSCHDFYGEQNKVGPYLSGVFGRRAGGARYGGYSEAMKRSGVVWDEGTLTRFLRDVQGSVPGTSMVVSGIPSKSDVDALVFYMSLVTRS